MRSRKALARGGGGCLHDADRRSAGAHAEEASVANPVEHVDTLNGSGTGGETVGEINERSTGFIMTHAAVGCNALGDIPMLPTTSPIGCQPWDAWEKIGLRRRMQHFCAT